MSLSMLLFNTKLLSQNIVRYEFPSGEKLEQIQKTIQGWQKALKDSDLNKTKETSIQGQFLSKFFEFILGYDTQSSGLQEWHLIQEPKTDIDSQEADGALGIFKRDSSRVQAVIELKDARTSLDKKQSGRIGKLTPVEQAFNYLNKFDGCKWVIVSNFHEIRLYSKLRGQGFYEKFLIPDLDKEQEFKKFFFLLNKSNLIDDGNVSVVEQIAKDTTSQEENITKQFYCQYKEIRLKLLQHLFNNNPNKNRLVLVEKTQKLLDRLIFIMVCEDSSMLLPSHLVKTTYERALQSFAISDSDQRIWTEFKGLFHAIDKGNKRVIPPINAYNGGLFKCDEELDGLIIKDEIWKELIALTHYDFESDLNVNVLGHIFEQSISDLEEIRESVLLTSETGENLVTEQGSKISVEQSNTYLIEKIGKRKKMGIFYTPEFITKFIVENTVGKYLEENPESLESIKILDPACGSGGFLNQAHSYLLNEYKVRTEQLQLEKHQKGEKLTLWDTNIVENDKSILLNNLFGVDLSPESVEITKLALWLKTAKPTEQLQNLDHNIKCGNSIVDDPEFAGDKAFNWKNEFAEIINKGGFDVIIGNPPYVRQELIKEIKPYLEKNYIVYTGVSDLYVYFFERSLSLLKDGGYFAFIVSNKFLRADYGKKLTQYLQMNYKILEIIDFGDIQIFDGATTYPCIITIQKVKPPDTQIVKLLKLKSVSNAINLDQEVKNVAEQLIIKYNDESWQLTGIEIDNLLKKIGLNANRLGKMVDNKIFYGIKTGFNDAFIIDDKTKNQLLRDNPKSADIIKPILRGRDIGTFTYSHSSLSLLYIPWHFPNHISNTDTNFESNEADFKLKYPAVYSYLEKFKTELMARNQAETGIRYEWYALQRFGSNYWMDIEKPKIIWGNLSTKASFSYDTENHYISAPACFIPTDKIWLLGLLNSKVCSFFLKNTAIERQGGFIEQKPMYIEQIPIPEVNENNERILTTMVEEIINLKNEFYKIHDDTLKFLIEDLPLIRHNSKLNDLLNLGWNDLVKIIEVNKVVINLEKREKLSEWFKNKKQILLNLEIKFSGIESNINQQIYSIYGLNSQDIKVIENIIPK